MKKIPVAELNAGCALTDYLCHASGEVLNMPGEILTLTHKALLTECAIEEVIMVGADEKLDDLKKNLRTKQIALENIPVNEPMPASLTDETGNIVAKEGESFSSTKIDLLAAAGTKFLFYQKDPMELRTFQHLRYRMLLDSDKFESFERVAEPVDTLDTISHEPVTPDKQEELPAESAEEPIPPERFIHHPSKHISMTLCKSMMEQPERLTVETGARSKKHEPARIISLRPVEVTTSFKQRYLKWITDIEAVFNLLKSNRETRFELVEDIARDIIRGLLEDQFYCCNLMHLRHPPTSDRYLAMHSANVAIACGGTGVLLGYSMTQLRELTAGAIVHDVGHLLTFRPLLAKKELDAEEQQKYIQHATVGMAMLKNITRIPFSTMFMVVQHHEWLDGSGRIFHAKPDQLHDFARLQMIVDFYESSCRFLTPSAAIGATVSAAQAGKLDTRFLKAFLSLLSVFPVGTTLQSADDRIWRVVGTHPTNFKRPHLRSIYTMKEGHLFPIDKQELVDMNKTEIKILGEVVHSALTSDISAGFRAY